MPEHSIVARTHSHTNSKLAPAPAHAAIFRISISNKLAFNYRNTNKMYIITIYKRLKSKIFAASSRLC